MSDKMIKARVVGPNYSKWFRGDVVEVTERELARVGAKVLVALDVEKKREEAPGVSSAERKRIDSDRAKREGWARREAEAERILREHAVAQAKAVIDSGGNAHVGAPPAPAARKSA